MSLSANRVATLGEKVAQLPRRFLIGFFILLAVILVSEWWFFQPHEERRPWKFQVIAAIRQTGRGGYQDSRKLLTLYGPGAMPLLAKILTNNDPGSPALFHSAYKALPIGLQSLLPTPALSNQTKFGAQRLLMDMATPQDLPMLMDLIQSRDATAQTAALRALGRGNMGETDLGPVLEKILHGTNLDVALAACWPIAKIDPNNKTARLFIFDALSSTNYAVHGNAALLLALGEFDWSDSTTELTIMMEGADRSAALAAAAALARMHDSATKIIADRALDFLVDHGELLYVERAVAGRTSVSARPLRFLFSQLSEARGYLLNGIKQIDDDCIPVLIDYLRGPERLQRIYACELLTKAGARSAPATPALIAELENPASDIKPWVIDALEKIGPAAEAALPSLRALEDDKFLAARTRYALRKIGFTNIMHPIPPPAGVRVHRAIVRAVRLP